MNPLNKPASRGRVARWIALACGVAALGALFGMPRSGASGQTPPVAPPSKADLDSLPDGPGKAIVVKTCLTCHNVTVTTSKRGSTDEEWGNIVGQMVGKGAVLTDDQADEVIDYLVAHFGPADSSGVNAPASATTPAPEKAPGTPASEVPAAATVNINKAGGDELQSSLQISKQEADAIVQYREKHGNFKTWQEVASVPGVTAKEIEEKQKLITF